MLVPITNSALMLDLKVASSLARSNIPQAPEISRCSRTALEDWLLHEDLLFNAIMSDPLPIGCQENTGFVQLAIDLASGIVSRKGLRGIN